MLGMEAIPALDLGFLFLALAFSSIFLRWLKGTTPLWERDSSYTELQLRSPSVYIAKHWLTKRKERKGKEDVAMTINVPLLNCMHLGEH